LQQAKDVVLSDGFFPCPPTLYYNPAQDPYCAIACLGLFSVQGYIQSIALTVSFGFISWLLMILLILTIAFKEKLRYPHSLIFNMSIAAFIGEFGVIISSFQNSDFSIFCKDISTVNDSGLCYFQALIIVFSVNSGILWWLFVCADLFQRVVFNTIINKTRKWYYAIAWGIPTIFTIIMMAEQKFGYTPGAPWCVVYEPSPVNFINWNYELAFLYIPMLVVMVLGTIFIIIILIKIVQIQRNIKRESLKNIWRPLFFLFAYMFLFLVIVAYRFSLYYLQPIYEASYGGYLMCLLFGNGQTCINIDVPNIDTWRWFSANAGFMGIYVFAFFGLKKEYFLYWASKFNPILPVKWRVVTKDKNLHDRGSSGNIKKELSMERAVEIERKSMERMRNSGNSLRAENNDPEVSTKVTNNAPNVVVNE